MRGYDEVGEFLGFASFQEWVFRHRRVDSAVFEVAPAADFARAEEVESLFEIRVVVCEVEGAVAVVEHEVVERHRRGVDVVALDCLVVLRHVGFKAAHEPFADVGDFRAACARPVEDGVLFDFRRLYNRELELAQNFVFRGVFYFRRKRDFVAVERALDFHGKFAAVFERDFSAVLRNFHGRVFALYAFFERKPVLIDYPPEPLSARVFAVLFEVFERHQVALVVYFYLRFRAFKLEDFGVQALRRERERGCRAGESVFFHV